MSTQKPFNPSLVNTYCTFKTANILMKWQILFKCTFLWRRKEENLPSEKSLGLFLKIAKFEILCKNSPLFNSKNNQFLKHHYMITITIFPFPLETLSVFQTLLAAGISRIFPLIRRRFLKQSWGLATHLPLKLKHPWLLYNLMRLIWRKSI